VLVAAGRGAHGEKKMEQETLADHNMEGVAVRSNKRKGDDFGW
jgi:hypothetical protein